MFSLHWHVNASFISVFINQTWCQLYLMYEWWVLRMKSVARLMKTFRLSCWTGSGQKNQDRKWKYSTEAEWGGEMDRGWGRRGRGGGGGGREVRCWVTGREVVVCVLDEGMEGVNPFLHHYLVSATALTLISLRAARPARSLPHPSIHPSTPFKPHHHHHHHASLLIPFTSFSFFLCSLFFLQRFPHFLCLSLSRCASSSSLWKLTEIPNP